MGAGGVNTQAAAAVVADRKEEEPVEEVCLRGLGGWTANIANSFASPCCQCNFWYPLQQFGTQSNFIRRSSALLCAALQGTCMALSLQLYGDDVEMGDGGVPAVVDGGGHVAAAVCYASPPAQHCHPSLPLSLQTPMHFSVGTHVHT